MQHTEDCANSGVLHRAVEANIPSFLDSAPLTPGNEDLSRQHADVVPQGRSRVGSTRGLETPIRLRLDLVLVGFDDVVGNRVGKDVLQASNGPVGVRGHAPQHHECA